MTVHWDSERCIHSERCVRGAPAVFDRQARPWVNLDGAPAEQVAAVIDRCPSGALSYTWADGRVHATNRRSPAKHDPSPRSAAVTVASARRRRPRRSLEPFGEIHSIASLRDHLQCAIELEHATLPPYLCALYSLDRDRNPDAGEVIESVFVEEMLHMTLAANLMNAVGGQPQIDIPEMLPGYPRSLPHGETSVRVSLLPFGADALEQFMLLERPAQNDAPPQSDQYETIGQFYAAIRGALIELCERFGEAAVFSGDPSRQIGGDFAYGGSGRIIPVVDLDSALAALDEIVQQGEGASADDVWDGDHDMFHPELDQVGHFYRLVELHVGRRFRRGDTPRSGPTGEPLAVDLAAVHPMRRDPRSADHRVESAVRLAQDEFNRTYCELLAALDRAFNGEPAVLGPAVGVMFQVKSLAIALMQMPTGDGLTTAGPTFEYVHPRNRSRPNHSRPNRSRGGES